MGSLRLRLPATSANLGAAFDTAAVALDFYLEIEAETAESFSITATGRDVAQCSQLEGNLILETYRALLTRENRPIVPLAIQMKNGIALGMGCGSSAAGRLAAIALAAHFGELGWTGDEILAEACAEEGHPDNAAACWLGGLVVASCEDQGGKNIVHAARVEPPAEWRAMIVSPSDPLATSKARAVLPDMYSRADAVANVQAASLLAIAFAQGRGDLLRPALDDRIHQPYRAAICPLLPKLLPLAGSGGILGVALSGAGPSVLLILSQEIMSQDETDEAAERVVRTALEGEPEFEIRVAKFATQGGQELLS